MIHLDTNFIIRGFEAGTLEDHQLRQWVATGELIGTSVVAWAEFSCGPIGRAGCNCCGEVTAES